MLLAVSISPSGVWVSRSIPANVHALVHASERIFYYYYSTVLCTRLSLRRMRSDPKNRDFTFCSSKSITLEGEGHRVRGFTR